MTLAFYPFGAFLAGLVLGSVFTFFALTMHLVDRAIARTNGSMLPGLVSGFRDWASDRTPPRIPISTAPIADEREETEADTDQPEIIELA